jgi:hypothetical protein
MAADTVTPRRTQPAEPAPIAQWVTVFLPAVTFFAHLQINYTLVPYACANGQTIWVRVVGVVSVLLSLTGTLLGWRVWQRADVSSAMADGGVPGRTRFLGRLGLGAGTIFTIILTAQVIAELMFSPCQ